MKMTRKRQLIRDSEIPDNIQTKKVYKKKYWRNEKGEIVFLSKMPQGWSSTVTGNSMRIYDCNNNLISTLLYW